jgi:hypothetical protein
MLGFKYEGLNVEHRERKCECEGVYMPRCKETIMRQVQPVRNAFVCPSR